MKLFQKTADFLFQTVSNCFTTVSRNGVREFVDDGRHFIQSVTDKYDMVVIDVLNGEVQPHHMFTEESCRELKNILSPDGLDPDQFPGICLRRAWQGSPDAHQDTGGWRIYLPVLF